MDFANNNFSHIKTCYLYAYQTEPLDLPPCLVETFIAVFVPRLSK